jgi:hypothetical protein
VSTTGKIWDSFKKKELSTYVEKNGYRRISIYNDYEVREGVFKISGGWQLKKLIHRLVAEAFIPNPDNLPVVDHINGNRQDNRVENLRWATSHGNSQNHKVNSKNKVGTDNVYWCNTKKRWLVRRMIKGKRVYIGTFVTREEAEESSRNFKETGEVSTHKLSTRNTSGHKNIYPQPNGSFEMKRKVDGKVYNKTFPTLEEAIAYRDSLNTYTK